MNRILDCMDGIDPVLLEEHLDAGTKKPRNVYRIAALAACLAVVLLVAVAVKTTFSHYKPVENDPQVNVPTQSAGTDTVSDTPDTDPWSDPAIVWADELSVFDLELTEWHSKTVSGFLCEILNKSTTEPLAIAVSFTQADDGYLYKGKTVAAYRAAWEEEDTTQKKLKELLKVGDLLRYGEDLYEKGTPGGVKWTKELYDKQISYFGEDFLKAYISDGTFLSDKAEQDLSLCRPADAQNAMTEAINACMTEKADEVCRRLTEKGFTCAIFSYTDKKPVLTVLMTADEFTSLSPEAVRQDIGSCVFSLASRAADDL